MHVTQTIESNVNILANSPMYENISAILDRLPFDHYNCQNITDAFMIPCFILFIDGNVLTPDNPDIDQWECCLTGWTGRMKKCPRCRNYGKCFKEDAIETEKIDMGPNHKEPVILLHADKKQREVEGLVALIPPMPVKEHFSLELVDWLRSTCLAWHKKALQWRKEYDQWTAIENQKYYCRHITFAEIATEKWTPKKLSVELPGPEFE
jgi:hypothetical protein